MRYFYFLLTFLPLPICPLKFFSLTEIRTCVPFQLTETVMNLLALSVSLNIGGLIFPIFFANSSAKLKQDPQNWNGECRAFATCRKHILELRARRKKYDKSWQINYSRLKWKTVVQIVCSETFGKRLQRCS